MSKTLRFLNIKSGYHMLNVLIIRLFIKKKKKKKKKK